MKNIIQLIKILMVSIIFIISAYFIVKGAFLWFKPVGYIALGIVLYFIGSAIIGNGGDD